ncbi:MAG TPA: glycosyltransferase family 4 protein [Paracoccaceae bacterium]|nr:glycosyltransferase family 4 protein [Paracoccaceae bacterium]
MRAGFAIPGHLATPTGGYGYARAVLSAAPGAGLDLRHVPLPGGFPFPSEAALAATRAILAAADRPLLVDGLAYGALPPEVIAAARVPLVALCHHPLGLETGLDPETAERLIDSEARALALAHHVVTVSETTKATIMDRLGVPPDRITIAQPGLPRAEMAPRRGSPPLILSVGSLTPRKGHDVLIRALARIAEAPWACRIAGAGEPGSDWPLRLRAQVAEAGLVHRITFLGAMDSTALEEHYQAADIFCLPSRYEGYGMVFAEAMMRGLPIVACRAGPLEEVVPASAGLLAPPDDDAAIADFLAILLTNRPVADRMAAAGRAHALTLPDWPDTAVRIAGVLRAVS